MKNLILIILLLIPVIPACDLEYGIPEEDLSKVKIENIYDYDFDNDIPELNSISEIKKYLYYNFEYEDEKIDYWKTPEEFYNDNLYGDCEDVSIMFAYLLDKINIYSELVSSKNGKRLHVSIYIPEIKRYYDIVKNYEAGYMLNDWEPICYIPYSEAMWMTINYHDSVGIYK